MYLFITSFCHENSLILYYTPGEYRKTNYESLNNNIYFQKTTSYKLYTYVLNCLFYFPIFYVLVQIVLQRKYVWFVSQRLNK